MFVTQSFLEENVPSNLKEAISSGNTANLNELTEKLKLSIIQVKTEITQLANENWSEIKPDVVNSENFSERVNDLLSKTNELKNDVNSQENLLKNVSEIEEYKKLIDHIESVNKIIYAIKLMQKFEKQLRDISDFNLCSENLKNLIDTIENEPELFRLNLKETSSTSNETSEEKEIHLLKQLKEDFIVHRERLWFILDQEWDKLITVEADNSLTSKFVISTSISQEYFNELTQFSKFKSNSSNSSENFIPSFVFLSKMKQFCKSFLKFCTINIINEINNNESLNEIEIIDHGEGKFKELKVKITTINEFLVDKTVDPIKLLQFKLEQIERMLNFLHENFFNRTVILYTYNSNSKQNKTDLKLMTIFSNLILDDFVKLIYEKLIINVIPLQNYDYKIEDQICKVVAKFEEKLKSMEFIKKENTSIFKNFVTNVEELYVRKKCQHIMEKARNMMKNKELFLDIIRIDQRDFIINQVKKVNDSHIDKTSNSINLIDRLIKLEESNTACNTKLDETNLLRMPTCSISKLSKKILELIYETLNEAYTMSDRVESFKNVSLFCLVAKNLFDLFSSVIPTFHFDSLREMPFLSAVAYNDFAYLAFNCLTITHQYKELFLKSKNKQVKVKSKTVAVTNSAFGVNYFDLDDVLENFSCLDMVPKLCAIGYEILFRQIQKQQENLLQFLNEDTNGLKDMSESKNFDLVKKSLERCKIQLYNIRNVWNVLPECVYFSALSQFLNLICNNLIRACLNLEDISSDDASYLHSAFSIVEQLVIEIFSKKQLNDTNSTEDSNNISSRFADLNATKYVKSWQRFKHTLVLLKANLQEIVDLWSDGKGPLAECFDSEEVRHLIKALFMITERRSAALAKII